MADISETLNDNVAASDMRLPKDMQSVFQAGTFILIFLTIIKLASDIVIPIVLAFVLKLVLQPVLRSLEKFHVPRSAAALAILVVLFGAFIGLGTVISGPAAIWAEKLPSGLPKLQERLGFLSQPIEAAQRFMLHAETLTHGSGPKVVPVAVEGTRLSDRVITSTRAFASAMFTTVLVLFFLLASGDTFLRRLVEVLPRFSDKRQAVDISQHIEHDISVYLLTITVMNTLVGIATGIIMMTCGLGDPLLWGLVAFVLNYVPIIGPMVGFIVFVLLGLLEANTLGGALVPATLYMLVHIVEGTMITPMILAKRFTLNPVLVILSLVFWYWMWGIPGAILAMPMLAVSKIICDRITVLNALGHFLEG